MPRRPSVPIIVAINKMDKHGADPERVKSELACKRRYSRGVGRRYAVYPCSAHTGEGIDDLLDAILLQAEVLELTAARDVPAQGIVIESRLDKGRGPVASLLIQSGTLRKGDIVLAGLQFGRVRAMLDENGKPIEEAGPSIPVEILGLDGTPAAGDLFAVVESEKRAREVAEFRQDKTRDKKMQRQQAAKLDNMFESMTAGERKHSMSWSRPMCAGRWRLSRSALVDIGNDEVQVNIVSWRRRWYHRDRCQSGGDLQCCRFWFQCAGGHAARKLVENEGWTCVTTT